MITKLTLEHLNQVLELVKEIPEELISIPRTKEELYTILSRNRDYNCLFGYIDNHQLVGITRIHDEKNYVITLGGTYVKPQYRGTGIGRELSLYRLEYLEGTLSTFGAFSPSESITIISEIRGDGKGGIHPDSKGAYKILIDYGMEDTGWIHKDDLGPILKMGIFAVHLKKFS